jgi:hypothetical protein
MTTPGTGFDPVAIVIDWLDACKGGRLNDLLDLYDDAAMVECVCAGQTCRGRHEIERYWQPRLASSRPGAFRIDDLVPDGAGVALDYQSYESQPVRMHFRFGETGKIVHTSCHPRGETDAGDR